LRWQIDAETVEFRQTFPVACPAGALNFLRIVLRLSSLI
jgi:hypothetical protein